MWTALVRSRLSMNRREVDVGAKSESLLLRDLAASGIGIIMISQNFRKSSA
jgi:ABC-type sugar transport system ATPase subunit